MNAFQRDLNSLQHRQQLLYILLFSFATVIVWIGVSLLSSQQKTGIPPEIQLLATPLNPTINLEVLSEIEDKRTYTDQELSSFPIYKIVINRDTGGTSVIDISQPLPVETNPLNTDAGLDPAVVTTPTEPPPTIPPETSTPAEGAAPTSTSAPTSTEQTTSPTPPPTQTSTAPSASPGSSDELPPT